MCQSYLGGRCYIFFRNFAELRSTEPSTYGTETAFCHYISRLILNQTWCKVVAFVRYSCREEIRSLSFQVYINVECRLASLRPFLLCFIPATD